VFTEAGDAVQIIGGLSAVALGDRVTGGHLKKTGSKLVEKGRELRRSLVGGEESVNERSNQKNNGGNDNSNPKGTHDKSPSIHSLMTNSNIKTPQAQTFFRKMADKISHSKVGTKIGVGLAMIGLGSSVLNASDGSGDFVPLPNQGTLPQGELVSPKDESLFSDSNEENRTEGYVTFLNI